MTTTLPSKPIRQSDTAGEPTATWEDIDIRSELSTRLVRPADYEGEGRALAGLAKEIAENPRNMLQKLVETAVALCKAHTAGISLLEGDVFRWEAVAGVFASYRNGTMPRTASPCGVCIDQNVTQLMYLADRHFPALRAEPRFVEALLIPFQVKGVPIGTVWIVSHDDERKFDQEDERIVRTLAQFASAGWQQWRAYEAAEAASRRKDDFLVMLGHELRNPLAAIRSATQVLQAAKAKEPAVQLATDVVVRQSRHLTRMVDDLLDLSRVSKGKLELATAPVELGDLVADALETSRAHIDRRGQQLSVVVPRETIWLEADAPRMAQLLSNLLDNASKYTPEGGQISLTAQRCDDQVEIIVQDTGIGIAEEQLPTVFDLFTQLGSSPDGGFGLGLALVRTLAEMHGGSAQVASQGLGKGSQFTIRLPTIQSPQPSPVTAPTRGEMTSERRRILVVEDNEDVAECFAMMLRLDEHQVSVARNGLTALEALNAFKPEVVLLDVGLPGMNGYEVARRMRSLSQGSELTIIALSGYGQEEHRTRSKEAGCDAYMLKPVDPDFLRSLLSSGRLTTDMHRPMAAAAVRSNQIQSA